LCLLTDDKNDNPIIIRPHIMFTEYYDWVVVVVVHQ
jgi:hypothetical protein